ncbi:hypothetical protein [Streptomyces albireticuli]|uniref:hypothetical protein n=1 Tax=Streptomyces albireticuli TaxID=1940 RepID=UPI001331B591|nr:hypothetical protein [Streptomyces albireticuli]
MTSFICRERGLRYAAAGRAARAADLLRDASRRYQASAYRADAAWLFTDVILAELMAGQVRRAAAVGEEQRRFVEEVFTTLPPATGPGAASAFTRPVGLRPRALTPEDHEMLLRYVRTSQFLVEACRHRSAEDFAAAVDLMSFGWAGFAASPYPRILRHLADRYAAPGAPWEVHLGADGWWHRMLRSSRVQVTSAHLVATAVALRARLGRAGLLVHGDVALLDAAVVHARLYGTAATVEWVTRYVAELRPRIPGLLRTAVTYLQASSGQEAARLLASYTALRTACAAPDLLCAAGLHPAGPLPPAGPDGAAVRGARSPRLEVAFYGNLLSVEGITIHRVTPAPLTQLLRVLGRSSYGRGSGGRRCRSSRPASSPRVRGAPPRRWRRPCAASVPCARTGSPRPPPARSAPRRSSRGAPATASTPTAWNSSALRHPPYPLRPLSLPRPARPARPARPTGRRRPPRPVRLPRPAPPRLPGRCGKPVRPSRPRWPGCLPCPVHPPPPTLACQLLVRPPDPGLPRVPGACCEYGNHLMGIQWKTLPYVPISAGCRA